MPPESALLDLLLRVGHLGEMHRLLHVLREQGHPVGVRELTHLVHETAGWAPRYPRPEAALALAQYLGFIWIQNDKVVLSEFAQIFLYGGTQSPVDLDKNQGKAVLSELRNDRQFNASLRSLLRRFREGGGGALIMSKTSDLRDIEETLLRVLQQVNCVHDSGNIFVIDSDFELMLFSGEQIDFILTEEGLWKRLEKQRLRARHIETLVIEFEKRRLVEQGRADLAEAVIRISENNVSAGYDIASFEADGGSRFIEVKSSVSGIVQFYWSENERRVALENNRSYWIYFVPFSEMCLEELAVVLLIQNPIQELKSGKIIEAPNSWQVNSDKPHQPLTTLLPKSVASFTELFRV